MQKFSLAMLAITAFVVSTVAHAEGPANPNPTTDNQVVKPSDILLTSDIQLEGQAILAPGTVLGGDMSVGGLKYGTLNLPAGFTLNEGTTLSDHLFLKKGHVIPSGTKIDGSSKFEKPDQLPAPAYSIGGNLIAGDKVPTIPDLTFNALKQNDLNARQEEFNIQTQKSLIQVGELFQQNAEQVGGIVGRVEELEKTVKVHSETLSDFQKRLKALESKSAPTTKATTTGTRTTVTMGTPTGTVIHDPMVSPPSYRMISTVSGHPGVQSYVNPAVNQYCTDQNGCSTTYQPCNSSTGCVKTYRRR